VVFPLIDPNRLFDAMPDLPWKVEGVSVFGVDELGYGTLPSGAKYTVAAWAKTEIPANTGRDGPGALLSVGMHIQFGHTLQVAESCYDWWLKNDKPQRILPCDLDTDRIVSAEAQTLYSLGIPKSHACCYLGRYGNYVIRFHAEIGEGEICHDESSFYSRVRQVHQHVCVVLAGAI
jgi:hypothetical protein